MKLSMNKVGGLFFGLLLSVISTSSWAVANCSFPAGSTQTETVPTSDTVGTAGQGGQLYARVTEDRGQLNVKWGAGSEMQCTVSYVLMPATKGQRLPQIQQFNSPCTATAATTPQSKKLASNKVILAVSNG